MCEDNQKLAKSLKWNLLTQIEGTQSVRTVKQLKKNRTSLKLPSLLQLLTSFFQ